MDRGPGMVPEGCGPSRLQAPPGWMEQGIGSSEPRRRGSQTRPSAHPLPGTGRGTGLGGIAGSSLDAIGDAHVPGPL